MVSTLVVKCGKRTVFLQPELIEWVKAEKDYVRFHQGSESFLVRTSMKSLSRMLAPNEFMRVHRSTVVNLDHVREMRPLQSGDYEIVMDNETRLLMSRRYRDALHELLRTAGLNSTKIVRGESGDRFARL